MIVKVEFKIYKLVVTFYTVLVVKVAVFGEMSFVAVVLKGTFHNRTGCKGVSLCTILLAELWTKTYNLRYKACVCPFSFFIIQY